MLQFTKSSGKILSALGACSVANAVANCKGSIESMKRNVGYRAVEEFVKDGMKVGLGTGTTTYFAIERLAQKIKQGKLKDVVVIPTSEEMTRLCIAQGLQVESLNTHHNLDVMLDSANEVDIDLNVIKGSTGAFLREKMTASAANQFICLIDETKVSRSLGPKSPVPVEIVTYCAEYTKHSIEKLSSLEGCKAIFRRGSLSTTFPDGENLAITDNGHFIVDLYFNKPIDNLFQVVHQLNSLSGVVDHGLMVNPSTLSVSELENFMPMPSVNVMVGKADGTCVTLGEGGESPWWFLKPSEPPNDYKTLENRQIS